MSTPTPTPMSMPPPLQQWQNFYPAAPTTVLNGYEREHSDILNAMASQHQHINQNIYQGTDKVLGSVNATSQYLSGGLNNVSKDVTQSALGLRDSIERGNLLNGNAIERTSGEIKLNSAIGDAATRQANADAFRDVLRSVDSNGALHNTNMERIGLTVGNSVERNAGEIKMNTVIADAASRQANADAFRDVLRAVDSNGALHNASMERIGMTLGNSVERTAGQGMNTTERLGGNIMTAIEKVAGEGRMTTTVVDAASRQAANDTARDIMSGVERNGANNHSAIQATGSTLLSTLERVSGEGRVTTTVTDAASRQAANDSARDIVGSVERNGANNHSAIQATGSTLLSTIERVAGEGRVTTTMTDASSRQASADSARDILGAVERNGGANNSLTASVGSNILSSVERNSGDIREHMLNTTNTMNQHVSDARGTIVDGMNRGFNEMLAFGHQNLNQTTKTITDAATEQRAAIWETRTLMNNAAVEQLKAVNVTQLQSSQQYASSILEAQKIAGIASLESSNQYSSLLLEQQRMKEYLSSKDDNHFAVNQLEQQKAFAISQLEQQKSKEYLSSKGDNHFAINQLEQQKVKETLAAQAAQNYASLMMEQQKAKEILSAQMAEAKYDALKNTQFLADKMGECCCEVKQKIDLVDRDRLRDHLIHERDDNSLYRAVEFLDRRGRGHGSRRSRSRSGSRERRSGSRDRR
jgi:hypothetical protein